MGLPRRPCARARQPAAPGVGRSPRAAPSTRWSAPRHALGCPCALGCFRLAASLLYFTVRCVYVAKSSRRAAAAHQQPKGLSAPESPTPPPRPSERREDSTARPRYHKDKKSPAGDSRGAHNMTLLDHSRAQERDAVAKTRPATASDTVVVRAPAGSLRVFFARDASHRVTEVRASGPLAGRVAVGDRLVSISTPGRALFTCGRTATGLDIVDELRAGAGSDGRVLTFARRGESALVSPVPFCCEPSRTCFIAMAMGCPCFIVAVILFIMNEIFYHSPGGAVISIFLFILSAAGCVAGCCCAAICSATPPGDDDVEAPAAVAAPRV